MPSASPPPVAEVLAGRREQLRPVEAPGDGEDRPARAQVGEDVPAQGRGGHRLEVVGLSEGVSAEGRRIEPLADEQVAQPHGLVFEGLERLVGEVAAGVEVLVGEPGAAEDVAVEGEGLREPPPQAGGGEDQMLAVGAFGVLVAEGIEGVVEGAGVAVAGPAEEPVLCHGCGPGRPAGVAGGPAGQRPGHRRRRHLPHPLGHQRQPVVELVRKELLGQTQRSFPSRRRSESLARRRGQDIVVSLRPRSTFKPLRAHAAPGSPPRRRATDPGFIPTRTLLDDGPAAGVD